MTGHKEAGLAAVAEMKRLSFTGSNTLTKLRDGWVGTYTEFPDGSQAIVVAPESDPVCGYRARRTCTGRWTEAVPCCTHALRDLLRVGKADPKSLPVKVGDTVRSFDFDSRDLGGMRACYVIGVVEAIGPVDEMGGFDRYTIHVIRDVFGGVERTDNSRVGTHVYPPTNGQKMLFCGVTSGVEVLA